MTTPRSLPTRGVHATRRQRGWVVLATLILSAAAASITVAWARHVVLAKGTLEMAHGASRREEASRSGLSRAREQMRQGTPPGTADDGQEDTVVTNDGDEVTVERRVKSHDRREIKINARRPGGDFQEEASVRGEAQIVPAGRRPGSAEPGPSERRTRLDCETGAMLAGLLTIVNGTTTYQDTELTGLFLLEEGSKLTLEDVVLRGAIVTRAGLCEDNAPTTGGARPQVDVYGGVRILAGTELPGCAVVGPDLLFRADPSARLEVRGTLVAEQVDVPCRSTIKGLVVGEREEAVGSKTKRPGHGRGAPSWPSFVVAGKERVTAISFPALAPSEAELDLMEQFDADG